MNQEQRPDRKDLKIIALRQSLVEFEDKVADLRVEITTKEYTIEDLNAELSRVMEELSQHAQPTEPVLPDN